MDPVPKKCVRWYEVDAIQGFIVTPCLIWIHSCLLINILEWILLEQTHYQSEILFQFHVLISFAS